MKALRLKNVVNTKSQVVFETTPSELQKQIFVNLYQKINKENISTIIIWKKY